MCSSPVLGSIIAASLCEGVGGTAPGVMGQLGRRHKKGSSLVRPGCSALIREGRGAIPRRAFPSLCPHVPLYNLRSGSVLGPGLGCSGGEGGELGWRGGGAPMPRVVSGNRASTAQKQAEAASRKRLSWPGNSKLGGYFSRMDRFAFVCFCFVFLNEFYGQISV